MTVMMTMTTQDLGREGNLGVFLLIQCYSDITAANILLNLKF